MRRPFLILLAAASILPSLLATGPVSAEPLDPGDLVVGSLLTDGALPFPNLSSALLRIDPATDEREIFSGADLAGNTTGAGPPLPFNLSTEPDPLAVERDGSVLISVGTALYRIAPATGDRTVVSSASVGSGPLGSFGAVAAAKDGSIIAADTELFPNQADQAGAILRVDPATGDRTVVSGGGTGTGGQFTAIFDLALESSGDIVVSDGRPLEPPTVTRLWRVDATSGDMSLLAIPPFIDPGIVAIRPNDTVFFIDLASSDLYALDPTTGDTTLYSGGLLGTGPGLGIAHGLVVSADGSALVSNRFAGIIRVDPTTRDRTVVAGAPPLAAAAPLGFFYDLVVIPAPPPTPALAPGLLAVAAVLLGGAGIAITRARRAGKE